MNFIQYAGSSLLALFLSTLASQARAETTNTPPQAPATFAIGMSLGALPYATASSTETLLPTSTLFFGYNFDPIILGLSLEFAYLRVPDHSLEGIIVNRNSALSFSAAPTLQYAFYQNTAKTTDIFFAGRCSFGTKMENNDQFYSPVLPATPTKLVPVDTRRSYLQMGLRLGLGVRYWIHPSLNVNLEAGADALGTFHNLTHADQPITLDKSFGAALALGFMGIF
jgi:hypothetical protein